MTEYRSKNERAEGLAELLEKSEDYRVLRRVPTHYANMPESGAPEGRCLALIDLETSGLDPDQDKIIELALMLVWIDEAANVVGHFGPLSWQEDPHVELSPEIVMLTGLSNQDLIGKRINDAAVMGLLSRADLLVAHNASFEIAWLERRYEELCEAPWACSMADIDWLKAGCDGRSQQHLLGQHGWFSNAHRAGDDVWSLFMLLQEQRAGWERKSRSHIQRLIAGADRMTMRLEAVGAPIKKKDLLKARGYRWNGRVWWKEIELPDVAQEQAWFFRSGLPAPKLSEVTAQERHR